MHGAVVAVADMDDSLKQSIIDTELSSVLVKSIRAYRMLIEHAGSRGFGTPAPTTSGKPATR